MISYLDTSFLVKLYISEVDSDVAVELLNDPLVEPTISSLSEVEMATAIMARAGRLKDGQRGIDLELPYIQFRAERARGLYRVVAVDSNSFELARELGERHSKSLGVRALDVLHVAIALQHEAVSLIFGTFDDRQGSWRRRWG